MLNLYFDACSQKGDQAAALAALEDCMAVYRPMSAQITAESDGQPDGNLIFYLY